MTTSDLANPGGVPGWVDWEQWENLIRIKDITIDRPRNQTHPDHPDIIYPIDYGFVNGTDSVDGSGVDIFVGSAQTGLVAAIFTTDFRRGDLECKLIYHCSPEEIYLVNGFINFAPTLMNGRLLMRKSMKSLFEGR